MRDRHARWLREGDMSVARRLAQIGVLGWIIVTPMLAGDLPGPLAGWTVRDGRVLDRATADAGARSRRLVRLEMDEHDVTTLAAGGLTAPFVLAACFAAGVVLGLVYFLMLRHTAVLVLGGGRTSLLLVLTFGRMALLVGGLYWASRFGALALLAAAAGVLIGRQWVVRAHAEDGT